MQYANSHAARLPAFVPRQSNSLWNPASRNRPYLDYNGRSGEDRYQMTYASRSETQFSVEPIRRLLTNTGSSDRIGGTVVIVNPFAK